MKLTARILTRTALCTALVVPSACKSTTGAQGAQDLVGVADRVSGGVSQLDQSIERMEEEIATLRESVDAENESAPVATTDLTVVYGSFMAGVEGLLVNLETVEEDVETLEKSFKRYFKSVQKDNEEYTNPVLQQRGAAREAKLQQDFNQLQTELTAFLEQADAYETDVEEVSTYLGTALTPMSVIDVSGVLDSIVEKGDGLQERVPEIVQSISAYTQTIRATGPSSN